MFSSSYMIQRKKCWKDSASEIFFFIIIIFFFFQSFYIHFIFIYYIMITCVFGITFEFYFLLDYLCSIWNENLLSFVVFVVVVQFIMFFLHLYLNKNGMRWSRCWFCFVLTLRCDEKENDGKPPLSLSSSTRSSSCFRRPLILNRSEWMNSLLDYEIFSLCFKIHSFSVYLFVFISFDLIYVHVDFHFNSFRIVCVFVCFFHFCFLFITLKLM